MVIFYIQQELCQKKDYIIYWRPLKKCIHKKIAGGSSHKNEYLFRRNQEKATENNRIIMTGMVQMFQQVIQKDVFA